MTTGVCLSIRCLQDSRSVAAVVITGGCIVLLFELTDSQSSIDISVDALRTLVVYDPLNYLPITLSKVNELHANSASVIASSGLFMVKFSG